MSSYNFDTITSPLGSFELIETQKSKEDPYSWEPPHWVANPLPEDYDIVTPPWLRPEQAAMSFVGAWATSSDALQC